MSVLNCYSHMVVRLPRKCENLYVSRLYLHKVILQEKSVFPDFHKCAAEMATEESSYSPAGEYVYKEWAFSHWC